MIPFSSLFAVLLQDHNHKTDFVHLHPTFFEFDQKEKVLHSAAKTIVITAESFKFVESFNRSVPVEVHPFALYILQDKLESEQGAKPELRMLDEGYPYITENGNFVLDTIFPSISDVRNKEIELKNIPGVIEVGLFTKHANIYYKANYDGSFDTIKS